MAETDGAKIIPGPGARPLSVRDEEILIDLARGVPAPDLAAKHGLSLQRIYNLKSENRGRFAQILEAERETLQVLKHEKFSDLFIMKEAPVMAGYAHIAQAALRRFMELDAASRVYDPETGQTVSVRMSRADVANMKAFAGVWNQAVMSAHEVRGRRPARLSDKNSNRWTLMRHTDPPTPEQLEARRKAREAEETEERAEREAQRSALMQTLMAANPVMQRRLWSSMKADPRFAEIERRIAGRYADEDEPESGPEPVPEPSVFVASVAAAARGTLALEFDPEALDDLEMCQVGG